MLVDRALGSVTVPVLPFRSARTPLLTVGLLAALQLVKTTGKVSFTANVFSRGTISLSNTNLVTGKIAALNIPKTFSTVLSVGNSADLRGDIDVNGKIVVGGGTVLGKVTHPTGTTYTGPTPAGGNITGTPTLPVFPALPPVINFPSYNSNDITKTKTITPGSYGEIELSGNQTVTLKGTGVYVFKEIENKNTNSFIFDFQNNPTGTFKIYVHRNVDLNKVSVSMINGGSASRIFTEVHGLGWSNKFYSFDIANGSSGAKSKWLGTVWAPYGAINIGSGTGNSEITGALWSGTQVNIQTGVVVTHAPFGACVPPALSVVDATVCSVVDGGITATVNLNDYVTFSSGTIAFNVNGSPIANPGAYLATDGDIISAILSISPTCSTTSTFKIAVQDKQAFGICAPADGKTDDVIGSELTSLSDIFDGGGEVASSEVFSIIGEKVAITIVYFPAGLSQLQSILPGLGMTDMVVNDDGTRIITGFFPIANLPQLNELDDLINLAYPSFPAVPVAGVTTTQGDKAMRSDLVKLGYDIGGAGVKIGVLSDSYSTLPNSDVSNGDLPGATNPFGHTQNVQVLKEYPYGARTDEGRAMLQIVHDVAPEADLAFRTGFVTAYDFAKGIKELEAADCDIICDDLTYINEPFFIDGKISEAVNYVNSQGVAYFTAAGNFGSKSYQGNFNPTTHNGMVVHNFGGGDVGQSITLNPGPNGPATFMAVLQWQDPFFSMGTAGAQNDFDIYLTNDGGLTRFGFNRNNLNGDPFEVLTITIREPTTTDIMIVRAAGTGNVPVKVVFFRGDNLVFNEHNNGGNGYSTIVGQANATGAMTVGAVLYSNTPEFNYARPAGSPQFEVASFSSVGGTVN